MKKAIKISKMILILLLTYSGTIKAVTSTNSNLKENAEALSLKDQLSVEDILNNNSSELENKLGRKLKLKDRFVLGLIKRKLKKAKRAGKPEVTLNTILEEDQSTFSNAAFFLGFLLPIIGIGLAYLFLGKEKAKASWLGTLSLILAYLMFALFVTMAAFIIGETQFSLGFNFGF